MKLEIEKIIEADDAAGKRVDLAGAEAEAIMARAREQAEEIVLEKRSELAAAISAEEESILGEARSRSKEIFNEAALYITGLKDRKNMIMKDLVQSLLGKVTGI